MKIVLFVFLGILVLNALVILAVAGILVLDQWKANRKRRKDAKHAAEPKVS
jgi:hypothetical protein